VFDLVQGVFFFLPKTKRNSASLLFFLSLISNRGGRPSLCLFSFLLASIPFIAHSLDTLSSLLFHCILYLNGVCLVFPFLRGNFLFYFAIHQDLSLSYFCRDKGRKYGIVEQLI